jgi:hypothetical protein
MVFEVVIFMLKAIIADEGKCCERLPRDGRSYA